MTKYRPGRFVERGRLEGAMDSMRKCSEKAATIFSRGIEGNGGHYYKKYTIFLKKKYFHSLLLSKQKHLLVFVVRMISFFRLKLFLHLPMFYPPPSRKKLKL